MRLIATARQQVTKNMLLCFCLLLVTPCPAVVWLLVPQDSSPSNLHRGTRLPIIGEKFHLFPMGLTACCRKSTASASTCTGKCHLWGCLWPASFQSISGLHSLLFFSRSGNSGCKSWNKDKKLDIVAGFFNFKSLSDAWKTFMIMRTPVWSYSKSLRDSKRFVIVLADFAPQHDLMAISSLPPRKAMHRE